MLQEKNSMETVQSLGSNAILCTSHEWHTISMLFHLPRQGARKEKVLPCEDRLKIFYLT